jgi:hypothetical protein
MSMNTVRALMCSLTLLPVIVKPVTAHHAFSPVYDASKMTTVAGVVTQFNFVNPHATLLMDVTGDDGKVVKRTVEFAGRLNLSEVGWSANSVKTGERVTVTGNPTRTGSPRMAFLKLVRPDGTELLPAGPQRANAIEEERRQRALKRGQQ